MLDKGACPRRQTQQLGRWNQLITECLAMLSIREKSKARERGGSVGVPLRCRRPLERHLKVRK